ncbi:glycosyltransferase family 2 protein [Aliiglaciecola sp. LCG003]|uniref:glycosyltransferase family 2 protein n=1 Tax=Aliiglaciecola sp. LCG003 TaxID=3053655 RepID=UPI002573AC7B|nr:glycosyltransferase family 2 protein [Aliiglaciecola sp. LCG003]WJG10467.1 glycosyltransferase family 2 protein [Aliiglaciecola sp. LCG003]
MKHMISVVIPFYQRSSGLLVRALESVGKQTLFDSIEEIIVVDDGSPIAGHSELAQLEGNKTLLTKVKLLEKPNGGVASARNSGIEAVTPTVKFIALLDPDDEWLEDHLALAMQAMSIGSDFHFSNFTHIGQTVGAFERAGYIEPSQHVQLDNQHNYQYTGDIVRQITTANVIGASSVIYDRQKHAENRFKENFRFAGEDYLMWLDITRDSQIITFTSKITTRCGEGINLFSGAKWGTMHLSKRLFDEINYRYYLLNNVTMSKANRDRVKEMLYDNRKAYLGNFLSMLKRLKLSAIRLFFQHLNKKAFRKVLFKQCE